MSTRLHKSIPLEVVAQRPRPGTATPTSFSFSPDDKTVLFLDSEDDSLVRQLYAIDIASGERRTLLNPGSAGETEDNLPSALKLERERRRELGLGVTRVSWAKEGDRMLIPLLGDLFVKDGVAGPLRRVFGSEGEVVQSPALSPNGEHIAYVLDAEIYVVSADGDEPTQITSGARGTGKTNGLAEFIAQEEMRRHRGFWWSPDGAYIAFTQVDESGIPTYPIVHQGKAGVGESAREVHKYPFAGMENAKVRLGVVPRTGGATVWMDLGNAEYLADVQWLPNGTLLAQLQNREQTTLDIVGFDRRTGKSHLLVREHSDVWINLPVTLEPLKPGSGGPSDGFLLLSERTGFRHIYLHDQAGRSIRALTSGDWEVNSLAAVDHVAGVVYFVASRESPLESHLYRVSLDGSGLRKVTDGAGVHSVVLDHANERYLDIYSAIDREPTVHLRRLVDNAVVATIHDQPEPVVAELGLEAPELVTLENRDGVLLHGALYRPRAEFKPPYPTIVSVYGGPTAQMVRNSWGMTADMRAQYLRSLGYLVFKLDNRGSANRGQEFAGAVKHDLGNLEIKDQVDGVAWLVKRGLTDPERVGIYGWSYGGYLAAMALMRAADTFKVAVAGASVTNWDGYDTHYTERYMGTPQSNPSGYKQSSVMAHVQNMRGKLMLVHGLIDENVHFRHTARLIDAMITARKDYVLQLFPNERHSPRRLEDRVYMEERVRDFFVTNL